MASTPKLTSCTTPPEGYLAVPVGADIYLFVNKKHRGNPWRELEVFTQAELLASQLGIVFFDLVARQIVVPDKTFTLVSAFHVSGTTIRLYWNPGSTSEIRWLDIDVLTLVATTSSSLPFQGRDPYVMDARVGGDPNRIYLTYVRNGGNYWRRSTDLGATWSSEFTIDAAAGVIEVEAEFLDPATKNSVQVIQKRS